MDRLESQGDVEFHPLVVVVASSVYYAAKGLSQAEDTLAGAPTWGSLPLGVVRMDNACAICSRIRALDIELVETSEFVLKASDEHGPHSSHHHDGGIDLPWREFALLSAPVCDEASFDAA